MVSMQEGSRTTWGASTPPTSRARRSSPSRWRVCCSGVWLRCRTRWTPERTLDGGRAVITDVSRVGKVTLSHALRVSSNVGIAKVAQAYAPDEQYETLRDFGFGMPTGVPLPGEASGLLRHPGTGPGSRRPRWPSDTRSRSPRSRWPWPTGRWPTGGSSWSPAWSARSGHRTDGSWSGPSPRVVRRVIRPRVAEVNPFARGRGGGGHREPGHG
jgi:hypothetical protein